MNSCIDAHTVEQGDSCSQTSACGPGTDSTVGHYVCVNSQCSYCQEDNTGSGASKCPATAKFCERIKGTCSKYVLAGMTSAGGDNSIGQIFLLRSNFSTDTPVANSIFNFTTGANGTGYAPMGSLLYTNSKFYGVTSDGGLYGNGTLFSFDPSGTWGASSFANLYSFGNSTNPADKEPHTPLGSLIEVNGILYGLASTSVANSFGDTRGALFSFGPIAGTPTFRSRWSLTDNTSLKTSLPHSDAVYVDIGTTKWLYWTTSIGSGTSNCGAVYRGELNTSTGAVSNIGAVAFTGTALGCNPKGSLLWDGNTDGYLYGTTTTGGTYNKGTMYKYYIPQNSITVMYHFGNGTYDGATPTSGVTFDSATSPQYLYGTTSEGGAGGQYANRGTIFRCALSNSACSIIFRFSEHINANSPKGSLVLTHNNLFYFMSGDGGIYGFHPDSSFVLIDSFRLESNSNPTGALIEISLP
jgi:uncharacterized repeat protein (TIGR03803 family)